MDLNKFTNKEILIIAVARLRGMTHTVDTEDAAIEAYNLVPNRFAWRKYSNRIDLEIVRDGLRLASMASPPLLSGTARDGWMLTVDGHDWINSLPVEIRRKGLVSNKRQKEVDGKLKQEAERLYHTVAWNKFLAGELDSITLPDYNEFARLNSYFPPRQRRERIAIVGNAARNNADLKKLWKYLVDRFEKEEIK
jgi:hypothetical protein